MSLRRKIRNYFYPPPDPLARFRDFPQKLLRDFDILSYDQGLLSTMQTMLPVDPTGAPIPWFTYPAIEYLNQFDMRGKNIFEYGCGNSTRYWARRGAAVWAVDHDKEWFEKMSASAGAEQTLYFGPDEAAYVGAIEKPGIAFDIVVIDGIHREACVVPAIAHLRAGGFIILDNAERDVEAGRLLRERGLFEVDFNGFGPINDYTWTTALFLPKGGVDQSNFVSPRPVGGNGGQVGNV